MSKSRVYVVPRIVRRTEKNKRFPTATTEPLDGEEIPRVGTKLTIKVDDGTTYTGILTRVIALDSGTKLEFKKGLLQVK